MISNIILLTGPIISGKTTKLGEVLALRTDVRGFLTPDLDRGREVHILPQGSKEPVAMQAVEPGNDTLSVGRYHFYTAAFDSMKRELRSMAKEPALWNVIDELGKLELRDKGLCPEIEEVIDKWKKPGKAGHLLIVVRDELLESAVAKFGLDQATVIQKDDVELLF